MSDKAEFPFLPPFAPRLVPPRLLSLPDQNQQYLCGEAWEAANDLIMCIQGWADWLYRLDRGERAPPMEAWELQAATIRAVSILAQCGAWLQNVTVEHVLAHFPPAPAEGLAGWEQQYNIEEAKNCLAELAIRQEQLIRFQNDLEIDPGMLEQRKHADEASGWDADTEARNKWIYDRAMEGIAWSAIRAELCKQPAAWARLESDNGVKTAAQAYATKHRCPPVPMRRNGRPKKPN